MQMQAKEELGERCWKIETPSSIRDLPLSYLGVEKKEEKIEKVEHILIFWKKLV